MTELRRLKYFPGLLLLHGGERRQRRGSGRGDPGRTGGVEEGVNIERKNITNKRLNPQNDLQKGKGWGLRNKGRVLLMGG